MSPSIFKHLKISTVIKKKIRELVQQSGIDARDFEVVRDLQATVLIGGEACKALVQCGTFNGPCESTLQTCGQFTEP